MIVYTCNRWMREWKISFGTEYKERSLAKDLIGANVTSETVAFTSDLGKYTS